jgi:hypothetical protein
MVYCLVIVYASVTSRDPTSEPKLISNFMKFYNEIILSQEKAICIIENGIYTEIGDIWTRLKANTYIYTYIYT